MAKRKEKNGIELLAGIVLTTVARVLAQIMLYLVIMTQIPLEARGSLLLQVLVLISAAALEAQTEELVKLSFEKGMFKK